MFASLQFSLIRRASPKQYFLTKNIRLNQNYVCFDDFENFSCRPSWRKKYYSTVIHVKLFISPESSDFSLSRQTRLLNLTSSPKYCSTTSTLVPWSIEQRAPLLLIPPHFRQVLRLTFLVGPVQSSRKYFSTSRLLIVTSFYVMPSRFIGLSDGEFPQSPQWFWTFTDLWAFCWW